MHAVIFLQFFHVPSFKHIHQDKLCAIGRKYVSFKSHKVQKECVALSEISGHL